MQVDVIASTVFHLVKAMDLTGFDVDEVMDDMDNLAEFAGRACYQSFHKPNPATATSQGYHENTLSQGHYSIYEHASITFYVQGVSRALTHELIRHRHLSYSQLSQRFVNESERESLVIPPALRDSQEGQEILHDVQEFTQRAYEEVVERLQQDSGLPRKQAREAARAVLPNATETKIVVTGNIRAWRDFLAKRLDPHADAEIREFAGKVLVHLRDYAPNSVRDIKDLED